MTKDDRPPRGSVAPVPARTDDSVPVRAEAGDVPAHMAAGGGDIVPRRGVWERAGLAAVAVICFIVAAVVGIGGEWLPSVIMVVSAACAGWFAITGNRPVENSELEASRRFRELADPTHPLTQEDVGLPSAGDPPPRRIDAGEKA